MAFIIALAGKGGTGKTTMAALLVRSLVERNAGSVLAVDADPNSNLGEVLGVAAEQTIGQVLDEVGANPDKIPGGMTKDRYIEYKVQTSVIEGKGFDCLTMGKPEGPGCYCYVNNVLRNVVDKLINDYSYVIIDNEAGLEHLSRRTTRHADTLLVIAHNTPVALRAAQRISALADELKIRTGQKLLLLNVSDKNVPQDSLADAKLHYAGNIPQDEAVEGMAASGEPVWKLPARAPAYKAIQRFIDVIIRK
ncbi:MAG: AAA family ATPase [Candidatus Omnitrophota bacterium]